MNELQKVKLNLITLCLVCFFAGALIYSWFGLLGVFAEGSFMIICLIFKEVYKK